MHTRKDILNTEGNAVNSFCVVILSIEFLIKVYKRLWLRLKTTSDYNSMAKHQNIQTVYIGGCMLVIS